MSRKKINRLALLCCVLVSPIASSYDTYYDEAEVAKTLVELSDSFNFSYSTIAHPKDTDELIQITGSDRLISQISEVNWVGSAWRIAFNNSEQQDHVFLVDPLDKYKDREFHAFLGRISGLKGQLKVDWSEVEDARWIGFHEAFHAAMPNDEGHQHFDEDYQNYRGEVGADVFAALKFLQLYGNSKHIETVSAIRLIEAIGAAQPSIHYSTSALDHVIQWVSPAQLYGLNDSQLAKKAKSIAMTNSLSFIHFEKETEAALQLRDFMLGDIRLSELSSELQPYAYKALDKYYLLTK